MSSDATSPSATPPRPQAAWSLLLTHVLPHRWTLAGGAALGLLGGLAGLAEPLTAKLVVDAVGRHRSLLGPVVPLTALFSGASQLQVGLAAVARMREIHTLPAEPKAEPRGTCRTPSSAAVPASITFAGVWFRYRQDSPWVHRDLTFAIPPGGTTAIVGPSGAGKTTTFALLERFYQPVGGAIAIDGRDLRRWSLPELRATSGYVEQDAPVLAGTLRDNLSFAAPDIPERDLHAVLALTRLDGLRAHLPDGLDTLVGHRGTALSGGERQRIAIARALLRRPRLLLLDEATSQLDAVNELALREAVAEMARTTTVLVIAHRLSTVTNADQILVIDAGRIRAAGTHHQLIASDDLYRQLAATQLLAPGP